MNALLCRSLGAREPSDWDLSRALRWS